MHTRRLGKSDLDVTPVILGAWAIGGSMWGGQDEADAIATIHACLDAGVNTIDTAPVYGLGRSEEIVAKALRGRRDRVIVATKCGLTWDEPAGVGDRPLRFTMVDVDESPRPIRYDMRPATIRRDCEQSLRRLGTDHIDLMQIHWPDPSLSIDDQLAELIKLRDEGKVRHIGVSNFSAAQLAAAPVAARIASDQPQYNLLDRAIEAELLPFCRDNDVGVIVYSPMARGLLTGKYGADHAFAPNDHRGGVRWFQPPLRDRVLGALDRAKEMAAAYGVSLGNLAVAWTLAQPGVTAALVGARTPAQARENARAATVNLRDDDARTLAAWFTF